MERNAVYFASPYQVEVRTEPLGEPGPGQVRVRSRVSAVSSGTELLIYRGQFPRDLPLDASIEALGGAFAYPLMYGYASVGVVEQLGPQVDPAWKDRRVFAFQPHTGRFLARPQELIPIPDDIPNEAAVLAPNMETAVNFLMDGAPLIGEKVVVFGQGMVGLLTTALLSRFPLDRLVTVDRYPLRRRLSLALGAQAALDPGQPLVLEEVRRALGLPGEDLQVEGADLVFELSGAPAALDMALAVTGFAGRVVVGSWYGSKPVELDLGGRFHRSRIRLLSSQVSSMDPSHVGRWDKPRRFATAWEMIRRVEPERLITHRFPVEEAAQAFRLLDQQPEEAVQVIFQYN